MSFEFVNFGEFNSFNDFNSFDLESTYHIILDTYLPPRNISKNAHSEVKLFNEIKKKYQCAK